VRRPRARALEDTSPFVVSNFALNVSGACVVAFAGSSIAGCVDCGNANASADTKKAARNQWGMRMSA